MSNTKSIEQRNRDALQKAEKFKQHLKEKYNKLSEKLSLQLKNDQQERYEIELRRKLLEEKLATMSLNEEEKQKYRDIFFKAEADARRDNRRKLTIDDFEPLAIIGRGAFGEVRLVRMKNRFSKEIYGS